MTGGPRLLTIRAELLGVKPPIRRVLEIDAALPLDAVHRVLQVAFGWDDSHLHAFEDVDPRVPARRRLERSRRYVEADLLDDVVPDDLTRQLDERGFTLRDLLPTDGAVAAYEYDFGDSWLHRLQRLAERIPEPGDPRATVLEASGEAAVDDVGGAPGWSELRAAVEDRGSPDHREALEVLERLAPWRAGRVRPPDVAQLRREVRWLFEDAPSTGSAAVDGVVAEMADGVLPAFRARVDEAALGEQPVVSRMQAEGMTVSVRWLLDRAAQGGIALTEAGRLPPSLVREAVRELGWEPRAVDATIREDVVRPVRDLRAVVQTLGLVRKRAGLLVLGREASRLRTDPVGLWWHLATRLLAGRQRDEQRLARTFFLVEVSCGGRASHQAYGPAISFGLQACGWTDRWGGAVDDGVALGLIDPVRRALEAFGAFASGAEGTERVTAGGRALARAALRAS